MTTSRRERNKAASVREWLARETPENLDLLTRLRERLDQTLDERPDFELDGSPRINAAGRQMMLPADVNDYGTPSRDWCRAYQRYQAGYQVVLEGEMKTAQLTPDAQRISAEEFDSELRKLALEALRQLPDGEIQAELARRHKTAVIDMTEDFDA